MVESPTKTERHKWNQLLLYYNDIISIFMGANRIAFFLLYCVGLILFVYFAKKKHNYEYKQDKLRIIMYFIIVIFYNASKLYLFL